jgi:hypothetical protein
MSFMAEPKPVASLSSGLLARKGAARPAMRRQGVGQGSGQGFGGLMPQPMPHDDLGWDDMGYDVDPPVDAPLHDEGVPHYGHMLSGAIPDAVPPATEVAQQWDAPEPIVPDVVRQQAEIAERMAEPEPEAEPVPVAESLAAPAEPEPQVLSVKKRKAAVVVAEPVAAAVAPAVASAASGRRAAFTLRLDSERHLKLRLASAVTGMSAQQLVTAALDEFLTKIPEIDDLAGRVPRPAAR